MAGRFDSTDIATTALIDRERRMCRTIEVRHFEIINRRETRKGTELIAVGLNPVKMGREWRSNLNNKVSVQISPPK